jgi:tetratricopeptide (TPR) repeat protein
MGSAFSRFGAKHPIHLHRTRKGYPSMAKLIRAFLPAVLCVLAAGPVRAQSEGQDDLDKATEAKLNADSLKDLSEVVRLTESALKKGLDEANTDFANKLLSSTLVQRAAEMTNRVFDKLASDDDFRQRRRAILADLEKAVKLDPKQSQAYLLIAQLNLMPEGSGKEAREALDKALELGIEEAPAHAKALVWRAGTQEQPEKKLADLDEAIQLNPGDSAAYEAKAMVLVRLKKFDEALALLEKVRQLNPKSLGPLVEQARVHAQQEKPGAALEDLNKALALDPDNLVVLLLRAGVYQETGDKEKALADVDRVLKLRPDLPLAIRTRAMLLAESKRLEEAIAELEKLRKIVPKDTLTLLQLGMLYSFEKKSEQAIEVYSAVLAEKPDEWRALHGRADAYLNLGKQAEAIADYEKAAKLNPKDESLLNNFAWVLATSPDVKLRDGRRAIELATQACELSEYKLAYILSTLAAAYAESGDFETAIKWSSKAVEIGDKEHDDSLKKELESYKAKKPWRELLPEEKPAEKVETPKKEEDGKKAP